MYEAEIHLEQEKECVLSELSEEFGETFDIEIEELHNGNVTFILDAGSRTEACERRLSAADSVAHHESIDEDHILVTKPSCSAYRAVTQNHGTLRRSNRVSHRRRVYTVLTFSRGSLRDIVSEFQTIGTATLGRLEEVGDSKSMLTARQLEVVECALDGGYYDWPREQTGDELAAQLGISRPTFLEHLRKAESKLLSQAVRREGERH